MVMWSAQFDSTYWAPLTLTWASSPGAVGQPTCRSSVSPETPSTSVCPPLLRHLLTVMSRLFWMTAVGYPGPTEAGRLCLNGT